MTMTQHELKYLAEMLDNLRRIAEALERIDDRLEPTARHDGKPVPEPKPACKEVVDYNQLEEMIESLRISSWHAKKRIVEALYFAPQYVGKDCASNLSSFYTGVTANQTREAIDNEEIEALVPEKKPVTVNAWNTKERIYSKTVVNRPVCKYQVSLKSTILWLEQHGRRNVPYSSPVAVCIDNIINQ